MRVVRESFLYRCRASSENGAPIGNCDLHQCAFADVGKKGDGTCVSVHDTASRPKAFDLAVLVQDRQRALGGRGRRLSKEPPLKVYRGSTVDFMKDRPDRTGHESGLADRLPPALDSDRVHERAGKKQDRDRVRTHFSSAKLPSTF